MNEETSLFFHLPIETPLNEQIEIDINEVFELYCMNTKKNLNNNEKNKNEKNNRINQLNFKLAHICLLGHKPSKIEMNQLFYNLETISKSEFIFCMKSKLKKIDRIDRMRQVFNSFDITRKGYITLNDLKFCFHKLKNLPQKQFKNNNFNKNGYYCKNKLCLLDDFYLEQIYSDLDFKRKNKIYYNEFCDLICKQKLV
jgi:Ca2+-binding EF-hand superfamily protein